MFAAKDSAEEVRGAVDTSGGVELPFPVDYETMYDFGEELELPQPEPAPKSEPEPKKESETAAALKPVEKPAEKVAKPEVKTEAAKPAISIPEESVYTMAVSGAITAPFSGDELVRSKTMGDWRIHQGVDIKGALGTDVRAIASGEVKSVETDSMMGNTVKIEHDGGLVSIYANLADGITLKAGDIVKNGDIIGKIGQSALCECLEEAHLHLETRRDGKALDPLSLFPAGEE